MSFVYVEPSIEELNARIAGGQVWVETDLGGTPGEPIITTYPLTPEEVQVATQPTVTFDDWNAQAGQQTIQAMDVFTQQSAEGILPPIGGGLQVAPSGPGQGGYYTDSDIAEAFVVGLMLGKRGIL